jgi:tetratricopeptide (TPR) repeat protein
LGGFRRHPFMNEGPSPHPDRDLQQQCVMRFEDMLRTNSRSFFDVEEFELIIDHYLEQSDTRRAGQALELARSQHPASVDLMFCEVDLLTSSGKLSRALEVLDAIGRMEPFNEDVHLRKAAIHSQSRNHRRAVEHYRRALELAEDGVDEILLDLAFEYESLEAYEQAIDCLRRALDHNPENEAVLYELAYCYELNEAHQAAVSFFKAFTNDHPYSFVAWFNLANALTRLERYQESDEALDLCLAIEEGFTSAWISKARNRLLQGDHQGAIDCYRAALEIDGPHAVIFSYIGECYEKLERYEQALVHYDQAVAMDPNWADAWIGRGVVKDIQGRHLEAVKDLTIAVRLAPENGDAAYFLAGAMARAGHTAEALEAFARTNALEPQHLDAWLDHADLLMHAKDAEAALQKLREAAVVHKLDARFRYRLAEALLRTGREQEGLLELEEALMTDHAAHVHFLEHFPEATALPQVVHLLELYRR